MCLCEGLWISLAVFPLRHCWWSKVTLSFWEWEFGEDENGQQKHSEKCKLWANRGRKGTAFFFFSSYLFSEEKKKILKILKYWKLYWKIKRRGGESWAGAAGEGAQSGSRLCVTALVLPQKLFVIITFSKHIVEQMVALIGWVIPSSVINYQLHPSRGEHCRRQLRVLRGCSAPGFAPAGLGSPCSSSPQSLLGFAGPEAQGCGISSEPSPQTKIQNSAPPLPDPCIYGVPALGFLQCCSGILW